MKDLNLKASLTSLIACLTMLKGNDSTVLFIQYLLFTLLEAIFGSGEAHTVGRCSVGWIMTNKSLSYIYSPEIELELGLTLTLTYF